MNEYCTSLEVKAFLGIDDSLDDPLIDVFREASARAIDEYCDRRFYLDATVSTRRYIPDGRTSHQGAVLYVHDIGDAAGVVVGTDDNTDGTAETTWTLTTDYLLEPDGGLRSDGSVGPFESIRSFRGRFPCSSGRPLVHVTAKWGWPAVPPTVKSVALSLTKDMYKSKESVAGTIGWGEFGVVRIRESPEMKARLWPYVTMVPFA